MEACDGTLEHLDASYICLDLSLLGNDCKRAFDIKIVFKLELE